MKKFLLFLLALCSYMTVNAQIFHFGPSFAGICNISDASKTKMGFAVGAKAEMNFNDSNNGWYVDASALFNNRNWQTDEYYYTDTKLSKYWKYSTYSVVIPVSVGYKISLLDNLNLFAAIGPYVEFGLSGSDKVVTVDANGHSEEDKVSSNVFKDDIFKCVNTGYQAKIGIDIAKHYQVNVAYSHSFTNVFKGGIDGKTQDVSLGFAYIF